ncbi:unnamed protein product [Closterium sp. Yama58-4]|nr:unnamed protein product [Closterium sp. Yama58-4]
MHLQLTIALLEKELLAAEASIVAVGASRGDPRTPFFEGCSPSPLLPSVASAAAVDLVGAEKVGTASASSGRRSGKGKGGKGGGGDGGGGGGGGVAAVGVVAGLEGRVAAVGVVAAAAGEVARAGPVVGVAVDAAAAGVGVVEEVGAEVVVVEALAVARASSTLRRPRRSVSGTLSTGGGVALAAHFDAILTAMYVMSTSGEGAEYLCVPPDPGIRTSASAASGPRVSATSGAGEAAALGASASAAPGTESTEALHTFTLDSGASRCFFRDRTVLEPLARPVAVSLADPSGGPVVATSSTVLPCPAVPTRVFTSSPLPTSA